jgi:hypothetical protein
MQPSIYCFLDAEGLVPPKLLQLALLHSTCHQLCQRRITVGIQQCLHVAAANACMREWRVGLTVLCMLVPAHFLSHFVNITGQGVHGPYYDEQVQQLLTLLF